MLKTMCLVSKRNYFPLTRDFRAWWCHCFCMKWEIGLRLQIVSNPALFAVLVQRDVFSKKFSTKLVKTFDRSCKIFEKLFVFDDFFVFLSPNAQNDSLLQWGWGFNAKRGWLIRRNIPLKKNNDANPCRVNEINSYICSCLTQVSAFAKNNIYDII